MATPAPADKVQDKEYTNWLKVTLALYYMKSGLHTFIQSEIDCLHQSLVQKIYAGQTVSTACIMCDAKLARRKQHTGVWTFQNQCKSSCSTWFYELLALHNNPKSDKIYWSNSDVSLWPFNPWECAKVFLPRGQQPVNTCPAESDAQALMVLLANCKHFHPKLSQQGQTLTHEISIIRNKVMHNGEMKVSDADRISFIQKIIQLLEDPISLKSLEDCKTAVSNIHKIDIDSVDVFFNVNQEMTALSSVVKELKLELGMQENKIMDNVDSLKEEYRQLREQLTNRFEDFEKKLELHGENTTKMFEGVEKKLELQVERVRENVVHLHELEVNVELHQQRLGAVEENVEIHEQRLCAVELNVVKLQEEVGQMTMGNNSCMQGSKERKRGLYGDQDGPAPKRTTKQNEKLHRIVLNRCLPELVRDLDFKTVSIYIQQKELLDDVTMCDILDHGVPSDKIKELIQRIKQRDQDTYDKFKECLVLAKQADLKYILEEEEERVTIANYIETATKGRPESESDGLRQLKRQTENKLDTVRKLGCIQTTQAEEAKKLLEEKRSVVIKGNPGEGKTTTTLHLIDNEMYRDRRVVVYHPKDWKTVDTDWVDIVVLEDILGKYDFDPSYLQEWMLYLPTIQEHVDAGKLRIIITTRIDILAKADSELGSLKLFSDHLSLTLSSKYLNKSEKRSILNRELQRHNKNMKEDEIEKCISNFRGLIGFPQCCLLFAADSKLFERGPEFFKSPNKLFFENIFNLKTEKFISLAFLFCHGKIYEEFLSPETIPNSSNDLFMEQASRLHISKENADITLLRDAYETFGGIYIEKSISNEIISGVLVKKTCIRFSHATVCEAVGQVLAKRSLEMVVKHGDPEYLYQRTYTAEAKDKTSENVFLHVSMYSPMAERMVNDVVEKTLVKSVAKHSVLQQNQFLMKLKDVLHRGNRIKDFFMASSKLKFIGVFMGESRFMQQDLSEGECVTFLQHVLQSDEGTVKLVYRHFMKFLVCKHNNNSSDCWQCNEKQKLLELTLYYHHFEIADQLITMNACYTHVSLCNAARHGDLNRVQTIMEYLKRSEVFNPECIQAKKALCQAYLSRSQDVTEILLQEWITLDRVHVVHAVQHGDISVLIKVVEHLTYHNKWYSDWDDTDWDNNPSVLFNRFQKAHFSDPCSKALYITYCNEKFDMADYLMKNEAKVSMKMLAAVTKCCSKEAVTRVIQHLKVSCIWDPHCDDASKVLGQAYAAQKYDTCVLLVQEGVSMMMKHLSCVVRRFEVSLKAVKKAVTYLKDIDNWDPKCNDASKALDEASLFHNYDVCDLLVQEGVSPTMKYIPHMILRLDDVKKVVKLLKDTDSWDPKCDDASEALAKAFSENRYDVCDLLIQEGVSLTINNLPHVVKELEISLEAVKKAVQHLKETNNWDPKCKDASEALEEAYRQQKYDVCDLLVQEKVSLTMKNLPNVVKEYEISLGAVKKAVQHLKDTNNWDPKCQDATKALEEAYKVQNYDVCDLLVQEGVSLTMKNFPHVILRSLDDTKKVVKLLKDTNSWDPKCDDASEALTIAYGKKKYDVCDLLIQEGVSLTMKNLPHVVWGLEIETVKKAAQHLKDTNNWDSKCKDASKALEEAYRQQKYDVCDLLVQEKVSLTMKNLPNVVKEYEISLGAVKKAVQHLKDTNNWDPKCQDATKALQKGYQEQKYDVCNLLIQEGVSLAMKIVPHVILRSLDDMKKVVKLLKDTNSWDPKCDDASEALAKAFREKKYDVCDLLIHEGVSLTMKNLPHVVCGLEISLETIKKAAQHLKDTNNWDPKCQDASKALKVAYRQQKYDVCDLLVQEGVSLTMKNLQNMVKRFMISLRAVKKAVQHLKDTNNWDPKCKDATKALEEAYKVQNYDMCDLLVQEGASVTMKIILHVILRSLDDTKKVVKLLKDTDSWDPKCDDASEALAKAYGKKKYDVCDLLIQEGVSLTINNLPQVVEELGVSLEAVKKAVQHLKDTKNWDPKCKDVSKALEKAYKLQKYDVCDLLVQDGASLTMKNLAFVVGGFIIGLEAVKKAVQHLKDTDNWDPKCDDASKALDKAYEDEKYEVCHLLIQEGVSLRMVILPLMD